MEYSQCKKKSDIWNSGIKNRNMDQELEKNVF